MFATCAQRGETAVPVQRAVSGPTGRAPAATGDASAAPDPGTFGSRLRAEIRRRPARLALACLATMCGPAVVAQADAGGAGGGPRRATAAPAMALVQFPLPGNVASWQAPARTAAATCPGLSPDVLVAIARVESGLGLRAGPSPAGARGPMQFLPATWATYGVDGDGDGRADVMNAVDALHGAARFLCANGGGDPERVGSALWNYNHSQNYVRHVLSLAWLNRTAAS